MSAPPTHHATAVLLGADGVLIRGPAASGKSMLAQTLVAAWRRSGFARLVADDRVALAAQNGRLVATPPAALAGRVELRGRGILAIETEPACVLRLVVDIVAEDRFERMPAAAELTETLLGVPLRRQPVPPGTGLATLLIAAALRRR